MSEGVKLIVKRSKSVRKARN